MTTPSRPELTPPDFNSGPYIGAGGIIFDDKVLDDLFDQLEDNVQELWVVCVRLAGYTIADKDYMSDAGLLSNLIWLGEEGVEDVRISSYIIAWKLLTEGWTWDGLLKEMLIIQSVKRNLRVLQTHTQLTGVCRQMLSLGFTEEFLQIDD